MLNTARYTKQLPDTGHSSTDNAEHCTLHTTVILHASCCTSYNRNFRQQFLGRDVLWCEKWGALNVCNHCSKTTQKLVWRQFWKVKWQKLSHRLIHELWHHTHCTPTPPHATHPQSQILFWLCDNSYSGGRVDGVSPRISLPILLDIWWCKFWCSMTFNS